MSEHKLVGGNSLAVANDGSGELEHLLRLSGNGDREAFARLCELRRTKLVAEVRRKMDCRLLRRVDPSDVIQEVFFEAGQRLDEVTGGAVPLIAWLRFLMNQKLVDLQRRHIGAQKRSVSREQPLRNLSFDLDSVAEQLRADITSPSNQAHRHDMTQRVKEMLAELSPIDREVLVLRHFHDLSNAEVAESLGLSPNASSNRYIRALKRLKNIMDLCSEDVGDNRS